MPLSLRLLATLVVCYNHNLPLPLFFPPHSVSSILRPIALLLVPSPASPLRLRRTVALVSTALRLSARACALRACADMHLLVPALLIMTLPYSVVFGRDMLPSSLCLLFLDPYL